MATRSALDLLVTHAALSQMVQSGLETKLVEQMLDSPEAASVVKNVCAKLSVDLSDEIDKVCDFLSISKRKFIEAALLEAVAKAKAIIDSEGVHEYFAQRTGEK